MFDFTELQCHNILFDSEKNTVIKLINLAKAQCYQNVIEQKYSAYEVCLSETLLVLRF